VAVRLVVHKPGKLMVILDTLSRAHRVNYAVEDTPEEIIKRLLHKPVSGKEGLMTASILQLCGLSTRGDV